MNNQKQKVIVMNNYMTNAVFFGCLLACCAGTATAFENTASNKEDISGWKCKYCVSHDGYLASITANIGNLSEDNYRFGNYSGVDDGTNIFLDADLLYLDDDARYFELDLQHAGLDSLALTSEYGVFGHYQLALDFQKIPLQKFDQLVTPFNNVGGNDLSLPDNWVLVDGIADPATNPGWSDFKLGSDWQRLKLNWRYKADNNFDYKVNYQRIEKSGLREFSAAQIWNATYLPILIDHKTDQLDTRLNYSAENWWGSVSYHISRFNNGQNSVTYTNPFISYIGGSEQGQLALEPDNKAYKLGLNFNYKFAGNSWAKLHASVGRMSQDESFLPYTTNPTLAATLPTTGLDAKVDTRDLSLRLYSRLSPKFSLRGKYKYHDHDNTSEQLIYQPVVTDSFVASEVINRPYDYETEKLSVAGDWRFTPGQVISVEIRSDRHKRNFTAIRETKNEGVEGKWRLNHDSGFQFNIKTSRFERDASAIELIDLLTTKENPLLQRYNHADRDEDKAGLQLVTPSWQNISASLSGDYLRQEYSNSELGLQDNRRIYYGLDLNWRISDNSDLMFYYLGEDIEADMAGSQGNGLANWFASSTDDVVSVGIGLQFKNLFDQQLDFSVDAMRSDADSNISVTGNGVDHLPEVASEWTTIDLRLTYRHSQRWTFGLRYQYDKFASDDFAIDSVVPGTVNNLLTFGAMSHNYDVDYIVASFSYQLF